MIAVAKSKSGILDIIFPPRCAFCRRLLRRGESGMCAACERDLPYTRPSERAGTDFVAACVAPLRYEGAVRDALHRYKFQGVTAYAGVFGRLVARCIDERLRGEYDLISWVPLSSQRLSERGYDQAMLIAMAAALELGDVAVETRSPAASKSAARTSPARTRSSTRSWSRAAGYSSSTTSSRPARRQPSAPGPWAGPGPQRSCARPLQRPNKPARSGL